MASARTLQDQLPSHHLCKDCDKWYGQEDDEYGPCMYKHLRKEKRYVTFGYHECDEIEELDIAAAIALTDLEAWGYTTADFRRLLDLSPEGCFAAELRGRVVGVLTT